VTKYVADEREITQEQARQQKALAHPLASL
jgi:hypothetical protein